MFIYRISMRRSIFYRHNNYAPDLCTCIPDKVRFFVSNVYFFTKSLCSTTCENRFETILTSGRTYDLVKNNTKRVDYIYITHLIWSSDDYIFAESLCAGSISFAIYNPHTYDSLCTGPNY